MLDDFAKLGEERTFRDYYQSISNFTELMRASLTPSAVTAAGQNVKMLVDFSQASQLQMNSLCDQYKSDATFQVLIGITAFILIAVVMGIPILRFGLTL